MTTIQSLLQRFWPQKQELKVLIAGFYGSGKTTILYRLLLNETVTTISTIGFNIETVRVPSASGRTARLTQKVHNVTIWDIGGCGRVNPLRRAYLSGPQPVDAVIWVVDAADWKNREEAVGELRLFLEEAGELVEGKPFLVYVLTDS